MNNVEKCEKIGILGAVRQRLGADSASDSRCDDEINEMTNHDLISAWCGWRLGDSSWWESMKSIFDSLEELSK